MLPRFSREATAGTRTSLVAVESLAAVESLVAVESLAAVEEEEADVVVMEMVDQEEPVSMLLYVADVASEEVDEKLTLEEFCMHI